MAYVDHKPKLKKYSTHIDIRTRGGHNRIGQQLFSSDVTWRH